MADIKDYTGKITSQHADKPKYMAMVEAVSQCFLDTNEVTAGLPDDFDLDSAVDAQLDDVGLWVGISRNISTPLPNVYFALDTDGLGFDQGAWKGPFDPDNGITTLDNEAYRTLLRAKIGANHWDGTLESSKAILDLVFNPDGHQPFIPVTANNETFGVGDDVQTAFQLKYQGQNVYDYTSATLYRNDWQGNQQLYPTPRTNTFTFSNDFTNAAWSRTSATVTASAVLAPDGSTMQKLVEGVATSQHRISRASLTLGIPWTVSVFAAAGERSVLTIGGTNLIANGGGIALFDLAAGVVTANPITGSVASMVPYPGGVYRCTLQIPGTAVSSQSVTIGSAIGAAVSYLGDGVSGLYISMAQQEQGNIATSYIENGATAASLTDYSSGPFGKFTMAVAPLPGAVLSWTGQGTAYASGNYAFLIDNQDMTITIGVAGDTPSATQLALLTGGYITLKPQSVDISYYISPTMNGPLFGFDASNQYVAGFDQGSWGKVYS